eukprot:8066952-Pyramimonas_sp.AAC.1
MYMQTSSSASEMPARNQSFKGPDDVRGSDADVVCKCGQPRQATRDPRKHVAYNRIEDDAKDSS